MLTLPARLTEHLPLRWPQSVPQFTLPAFAARLGRHLPQTPPTLALVTGLNLALGRLLPAEDLEPLTGKRLQLEIIDLGMTLRYRFDGRFHLRHDQDTPDLTLRARLRDYLALALQEEDPDTLFFSRRLVMEGDTDLGLLVKNTLDAVDWDGVMEELPKVFRRVSARTLIRVRA